MILNTPFKAKSSKLETNLDKVSVSNYETNEQKSQSQYQDLRLIKNISISHKVETSLCKVSFSVSTCGFWPRSPLPSKAIEDVLVDRTVSQKTKK